MARPTTVSSQQLRGASGGTDGPARIFRFETCKAKSPLKSLLRSEKLVVHVPRHLAQQLLSAGTDTPRCHHRQRSLWDRWLRPWLTQNLKHMAWKMSF